MKKTRKLISMIVALMACTFIACSGGSSSSDDDDDDASFLAGTPFSDCTRTVSSITLSDGNWTYKATVNENGIDASETYNFTVSGGRYTFTSGSATGTMELDDTTTTLMNLMTPEERDALLRETIAEDAGEDVQFTINGNQAVFTAPMSQQDLQEMQEVFDLSSLPPTTTIKTNADNTKYVITDRTDPGSVMYLSKN